MLIEPGSRILFTGDSITDCGRAHPYGDSADDGLGGGYVAMIDWLLASTGVRPPVRVLNTGVSGNTVRDLAARWQDDVIKLAADWVSVMIGINDVWRQFDTDPALLRPVTLDEYATTLQALLEQTRPHVEGLVVMLPFYLEDGPDQPMRAMRDRYAEAAADAALRVGAVVVDTQAALERILPIRRRDRLSPDGVHPTGLGHMALARAWLEAMGALSVAQIHLAE
jgi:lysophospholipase L1-like esterase